MNQKEMVDLKEKMILFLKNEVSRRGFDRAVFGLSGGLDSAVVAYLLKEAFDQKAMAVLMPSMKSSKSHFQDAIMLVQTLDIPHQVIPLEAYEAIFSSDETMNNVRYGNFCARMRMMILYDLSSKNRALVIGTSNKSERILGYGTIFGDLACAINPIGDMFKTDLFAFAQFLGVPKSIIEKKPSADLYQGQNDEEDLQWSYQEIDSFLKKVLQKGLDFNNCDAIFDQMKGEYTQEFLSSLLYRIKTNAFKLNQPQVLTLISEN